MDAVHLAAAIEICEAKELENMQKEKHRKKWNKIGIVLITSPFWLVGVISLISLPFQISEYQRTGCFYDVECSNQFRKMN